jgi:hypothetical protein
MASNWDNPLIDFANTGMNAYSAPSSTASIGSGGSGYSDQNYAFSNFLADPGKTMDFAKYGWGDPSKSGGMGGSSFGAGDLINGLLGFLGTMQQMKIAKKQLELGKQQLAASKGSYATDALTQAEQYNREWTNRMKSLQGDPEIYKQSLSAFYDNPNDINRLANTYTQNVADWKSKEGMDLLNTQGTDLRSMLSGWANAAGATTTPTSTATALASYGQPTQALTDQTNTAPTTAVKKPEEQTVKA